MGRTTGAKAKDEGISDGAGPVYAAAMTPGSSPASVQVDKAKHDGATAVPRARKELLLAKANPNLARHEDGVTPTYMAELSMLLEANADPQPLTTKGPPSEQRTAKGGLGSIAAAPGSAAGEAGACEDPAAAQGARGGDRGEADPNLETDQGNRPLSLAKSGPLRKLLQAAGALEAEATISTSSPAAKGKAKAKAKASFVAASSNATGPLEGHG
eukprot:Skav207121  [mRNA]  locus=scaffold1369:137930:147399:- [translate_table: standard]